MTQAAYSSLHQLANPSRFMRLSGFALPWLAGLAAILFLIGLYVGFFASPPERYQGETVRIMYIHVPAAWLAMLGYIMVAVSSAGLLIWRHPLADVAAKAGAPIGAAFTLQALVTGALWGKPTWGTYWVWDARLTSMLVLFMLYLGLIALRHSIEDQWKAGRAAAILALVGVVNIPIIKFSVDWWSTLHQQASVMRLDGTTIHPDILWPLLLMTIAFTTLFVALHLAAMRNEILRRRLTANRLRHVDRALVNRRPGE